MTTTQNLDRVTRLLRDATTTAPDEQRSEYEMPFGRDEAISKLATALRARKKRSMRRRIGFGFGSLAVAATIALVATSSIVTSRHNKKESALNATGASTETDLGRLSVPPGAVTVVRSGHTEQIGGGERVSEGTELRTPALAEAQLEFDTGTHVTIGAASRVRLIEQRKKKLFAVEAGSFTAKVAKLGADERFVVATPDAEVEVRGTAFRVALTTTPDPSCENGTPTRLEVTEGVVVVRHGGHETPVAAGDHWPQCGVGGVTTQQPQPKPTPSSADPSPSPKTSSASKPHLASSASLLSEQNDLFDAAMHDKRAGKTARAIATLDRLLANHPNGPLAENATVERMRLLEGGTEKKRAARDYLARWPHGFARAEAEILLAP